MTAIWSVNRQQFIDNAKKVRHNQNLMAVVKNNAYNYGLEFSVEAFLEAGIDTFLSLIHI